jgi:DNA polymerase III gamma/tau subunit
VARSSEGSLRDAKKILDQAIALSEGGDVKDQNVIDILGVIDEETFIDLSKNIFTKDRKAIIEQVNTLAERGMDLRFFYNEYLKFLRDLMVLKSLDESEKLHNLNPENIPRIKEILKNVREIELLRYFNAAKDLEQTMRNTENPRIILEYLFLKLSYFSSLVSIEDLIDEVKSGRRAAPIIPGGGSGGGSGERTAQQPASPSSSPSPSPMDAVVSGAATAAARMSHPGGSGSAGSAGGTMNPEQLKNLLVEKISPERPRWAPALGAASFEMGDSKLVITLTADFELAYNTIMDQPDYLKKTVLGILKRNIDIEIALADTSANNENAKIENLKTDEKITNLMDKIKGKIVNIE